MKLLCKKTILVIDDKYPLIPGKYYTFKKTTGHIFHLEICIYKLRKDNNWYYSFSDYPKTLTYIWDYFYTPQEERKIKLQKINETAL